MKNKLLSVIICFLVVITIIFSCIPVSSESTISNAQNLIDSIIDYKLGQSGVSSCQDWIDGPLTENAGVTSEWYILGLSQSEKYNFSLYQKALKNYLNNNEVYSATSRQKYALVLIATGSNDKYIAQVLNDTIGNQGIMSWIYGLHLLNNGYESKEHTLSQVKEEILSLQLSSGGWTVMGANADTDVTAMAIQSLAPYYKTDTKVKTALNKALTLLSERQLDDGDYSSYGVPNLESTAQVVTALSSLGIDCEKDNRFIKNGNSLINSMKKYQLSDDSFCHKLKGSSSETATAQAYYSLIAYVRMTQGKSGLYILDNRNPNSLDIETVIQATKGSTASKKELTLNKKPSSNKTETSTSKKAVATDKTDSTKAIENNTEATEKTTQKSKNNKKRNSTETLKSGTQVNTTTRIVEVAKDTEGALNYKSIVCIVIVGIGAVVCLVFFVAKKRNKKNFIATFFVVLLVIAFVLLTDFKSTNDYYNGKKYKKENVVGTVTMTVRCDTIVGKSDSEYIPKDGVILTTSEFEIEENTSVYDILVESARIYNIQIDNCGSEEMAYIASINYLYEFDFGDRSGWVYRINRRRPSIGCSEYVLSDGDEIEWLYTCELGRDLD